MSASESSPLAAHLQESIELLVAETVRRSHTTQEEEQQKLREAVAQALIDIEAGQAAMNRAATNLRAALEATVTEDVSEDVSTSPSSDGHIPITDSIAHATPEPEAEPIATRQEVGAHGLDVIAHDVAIGMATNLQALLRVRPEVRSAQTREFVNGELRLHLEMESGLDTAALAAWLAEHNGRIATQTDSVIEIRFGD